MSGYILVVWGSILPLNIMTEELNDKCFDLYDKEILRRPYSGNGEAPYWVGVEIASIKQYSWPIEGYEIHSFEPTESQIKKAEERLASVPDDIRALMTPIGRYVLPCP